MKVLGVACSPRKHSNTEILINEALAGAREAGAETEHISLVGKEIKPCDDCDGCIKTGECVIEDDMQALYSKLLDADGIIFGTPVYFWSMAGLAKNFIDRTIALRHPTIKLASKVGGTIVVAGRTGGMNVAANFYIYFARNHMLAADEVCAYASGRGMVRRDKYAMKAASEQGRMVVALINTGFRFPEEYQVAMYSYIAEKYGIRSSPSEQGD